MNIGKVFYCGFVICLCSIGPLEAAEIVKFVFNPPEGTSYVETMKTKKVKDFGGRGTQLDEGTQRVNVTINKTADGFSINATPITVVMTRDGKPLPEYISQAMVGVNIEYQLDEAGQIRNLVGYDQVVERFKAVFPSAPPAMMKVLNEQAMISKDTAEYNGRIGDFIGKEFQIGDVISSESQYTLPDGSNIGFTMVTVLQAMQSCGEKQCVRIRFAYDSNPNGLKDFLQDVYEELDEQVKASIENIQLSDVSVSGHGSRLIDPKTMLIYEESLERVITMSINLPRVGRTPMTMTETKDYSYQYE